MDLNYAPYCAAPYRLRRTAYMARRRLSAGVRCNEYLKTDSHYVVELLSGAQWAVCPDCYKVMLKKGMIAKVIRKPAGQTPLYPRPEAGTMCYNQGVLIGQ